MVSVFFRFQNHLKNCSFQNNSNYSFRIFEFLKHYLFLDPQIHYFLSDLDLFFRGSNSDPFFYKDWIRFSSELDPDPANISTRNRKPDCVVYITVMSVCQSVCLPGPCKRFNVTNREIYPKKQRNKEDRN